MLLPAQVAPNYRPWAAPTGQKIAVPALSLVIVVLVSTFTNLLNPLAQLDRPKIQVRPLPILNVIPAAIRVPAPAPRHGPLPLLHTRPDAVLAQLLS